MKKLLKNATTILLIITVAMSIPTISFAGTADKSTSTVVSAMATKKVTRPAITVKSINNDYLKIAWKKCSGASKYLVYRKVLGGNYKLVKTTTKTYYNNYDVRANVKYYYKVLAQSKSGKKSSYSVPKYNKVKLNTDTYYGLFGVPDFGKYFDIELENYYIEDYETGFFYRGGKIIHAGYSALEVIDLYSDLLNEYGFDYIGTSLIQETMVYYFSRNDLDDVCIMYDRYGITITAYVD